MYKVFVFIFLFFPGILQAGDYELKLRVKELPERIQPVLLRIYNGNMFMLDSTAVRQQEQLSFRIPAETPPGMLRVMFAPPPFPGSKPVVLDVLFNRENINLSMDYLQLASSVQVNESKENQIYFDFLKNDALSFRKLMLLEQVLLNYPEEDEFYHKAVEYYKKIQLQRSKFMDKTYAANKNSLAGKIIRNLQIPFTDGTMKPAQRDSVFRQEFLSQVDFSDTTLLYTNVYTDRVFQFIQLYMNREASPRENEANCIQALDRLVIALEVNPIVQQNILQFLIAGFESMKMEEVLAHISANYIQQCGGSGEIIKRRLEGYQRMAIGQKVPDFTLIDIDNNPVNLYSTINPYTLILFWHTGCSHCQTLMQALPELSKKESFTGKQIQIIGISIDEDPEAWKNFSATYPLNWQNTRTNGGFDSDIAADFNLFATPTMFLINEKHEILAKPTTLQELEKNIQEL